MFPLRFFPFFVASLILGLPLQQARGEEAPLPGSPRWSRKERVRAFENLCDGLRKDYAAWSLKKKRGIIDPDRACAQTILHEGRLPDPRGKAANPVAWAKHNLEFHERLARWIAQFQDAHLGLRTQGLGTYTLPVLLSAFSGNTIRVIGLIRTRLPGSSQLELGDEVVSWDQESVQTVIKKQVMPLVSDGTRESAFRKAALRLTERRLPFPRNAQVRIGFRKSGTQSILYETVNWRLSRPSPDQTVLADQMGMNRVEPEKPENVLSYDNEIQGTDQDVFYALEDDYGPNQKVIVAKQTEWESKKTFYLAIFSFESDQVRGAGDEKMSFEKALDQVIQKASLSGLPLVLDLRSNHGGSSKNAETLLRFLTAPGTFLYPRTAGFALNASGFQLAQMGENEAIAFSKAAKEKKKTSFGVIGPAIRPAVDSSGKEIGFAGKMVVLISDNCRSGCEIVGQILRGNRRGKFIGTPTAGMGAGFLGTNRIPIPEIRISNAEGLTLEVPNFLFGPPTGEPENSISSKLMEDWSSENRSVKPDIYVEPTLDDLKLPIAPIVQRAIQAVSL